MCGLHTCTSLSYAGVVLTKSDRSVMHGWSVQMIIFCGEMGVVRALDPRQAGCFAVIFFPFPSSLGDERRRDRERVSVQEVHTPTYTHIHPHTYAIYTLCPLPTPPPIHPIHLAIHLNIPIPYDFITVQGCGLWIPRAWRIYWALFSTYIPTAAIVLLA